MLHHGQRLPLRPEPCYDLLGIHTQLDDFQRHAAADGFFLLGHIDHAATAFADLLQQFVVPDAVAGFLGGKERQSDCPFRSGRNGGRSFEAGAR